jgi:large subunit ribosomal protein L46
MVKAGVVLSRPPLLTRELHPFEKAFFFYQRRLNEKLALPFTRYFYYQKDTPADINWRQKLRKRLTPAHDLGVFNAFGADRDRDELLVGATESEPQKQVEDLLNEAVVEVQHPDAAQAAAALKEKAGKVERPLPRETEADRNGDMRSLNRALAKTLYLIVKGADGCWMFPHSGLLGKESLHRVSST